MKLLRIAIVALAALLATACANRMAEDGKRMIDQGQIEDGLTLLEMAARENPRDLEVRARLYRERDLALNRLLDLGDSERAQGNLEYAEAAYGKALRIDPNQARAKAGLAALRSDGRLMRLLVEAEQALKAGNLAAADSMLRTVLSENPALPGANTLHRRIAERVSAAASAPTGTAAPAALTKPITLEFRDTPIRAVFEMVARSTGMNFIFDKDVRPDIKVTVFVRNSSIEDTIKLVLITNQLERKYINENSVLIYPNTPAKQKEYQEFVVRTIFLGNLDAKTAAAMLKGIAKTRDVFVDEKLNALVIRDTAEGVRLAEQMIAAQDQAEPEVMLEVEVLEVKRTRMRELGLQFPNQLAVLNIVPTPATTIATATGTVTTTSAVTTTSQLTLDALRGGPSASQIGVAPNPLLNLKNETGNTNLLANPRIRVKNRDKAKVHIGDRVPVITSTSTANVGVSQSVTYLDVGLKLEVEPSVLLDDDVSIKVALEVSSITREIAGANGSLSYQVGTRNATTSLRLKNGETQVLAGLINDEDRKSTNRLPFLGDLPVIGRLFGSDRNESNKTEIVLLITPRVVRNLVRPERSASEFAGGTDNAIGSSPLRIRPTAANTLAIAPQGAVPGGAATAATEPIRTDAGAGAPSAPAVAMISGAPQAGLGKDFSVSVSFPPSVRTADFDLLYDRALVASLRTSSAAEASSGRVRLHYENPTGQPGGGNVSAGFHIIATAAVATQLTVDNVIASGESGVSVPVLGSAPFVLNIVP